MALIGVGALRGLLRGNEESVKILSEAYGKRITALDVDEDRLLLCFDDGSKVKLSDEGQSCCERRWMSTDDDLAPYVGATLTGVEVREGPVDTKVEDDWDGVTESQFLVVTTSAGRFTVVNYNDHNGYYGGFRLEASKVE